MLFGHLTQNRAFFRNLFSPDCRKCLKINVAFRPCGKFLSRFTCRSPFFRSLYSPTFNLLRFGATRVVPGHNRDTQSMKR